MSPRTIFFIFMVLLWGSITLGGCQTITSFLPPQPCKPAADLPAEKHLTKLPEVDTPNDAFYGLFVVERAAHKKDAQDYNSLYSQCVGGSK